MSQNIVGQLDLLAEIERIERHRTPHAPLRFHQDDTWTPGEIETAFELWAEEHGRLGCITHSHMWHETDYDHMGLDITDPAQLNAWAGDRRHLHLSFTADLRCIGHGRGHHGPCYCVGQIIHRSFCLDCQTWTPVRDNETAAVRDQLDHGWPGWRDLPILHRTGIAADSPLTIPEDYPRQWQTPGAPCLTARRPMGTRAIPGNSPWGGYDYGVIVEDGIPN